MVDKAQLAVCCADSCPLQVLISKSAVNAPTRAPQVMGGGGGDTCFHSEASQPFLSSVSVFLLFSFFSFRHMLGVAREIEANAVKRDPSLVFKTGFHAVPSMDLLHAHIVSQDFDSSWLKTKKHWNSFASEFFLSAEFVLSELTSKVS
jgi:hypothetical protein